MARDERVEVRIDVISDPRQLERFRRELQATDRQFTDLNKRIREYQGAAIQAGRARLSIADTDTIRRAERGMYRVNKQLREGIVVQEKLNKARRDAERMHQIYIKTNKRLGWSEKEMVKNLRLHREALIKNSKSYRKANNDLERLREQTFRARSETEKLAHAQKVLRAAYKAGSFGVEKGIRAWFKYRRELSSVRRAIRRTESEMNRSRKTFERWTTTINALKYGTIALAIREVGHAVGFVAGTADKIRLLRNRLTELSGTSETFDAIVQAANRAGADLDTAVKAASRLAVATKDLNLSVQDFAQMNENILKLGILGGATATDLRMATIQLSQGLASATFQGDELRTVLESMPILMDQLADRLGVARGQMKQLGKEGALTPERVVPALLEMTEEVNRLFSKLPFTFQQTMNVLNNEWMLFIESFDDFTGFGGLVKDGIFDLIEFMQKARIKMSASPAVSSVGKAISDSWTEQIRSGFVTMFDEQFMQDIAFNTEVAGQNLAEYTGKASEYLMFIARNWPAALRGGFQVIFGLIDEFGTRWKLRMEAIGDFFKYDLPALAKEGDALLYEGLENLIPGDLLSDKIAKSRAAADALRFEAWERELDRYIRAEAATAARRDNTQASVDEFMDADIRYQQLVLKYEEERLEFLRKQEEIREKMRRDQEIQDAEVLTAGLEQERRDLENILAAYKVGIEEVEAVELQIAIRQRQESLRLQPNQEEALNRVAREMTAMAALEKSLATVESRQEQYNKTLETFDELVSKGTVKEMAAQWDALRATLDTEEGRENFVARGTAVHQEQMSTLISELGLETSLFVDEWAKRHELLKEAEEADLITKQEYMELESELRKKHAEEQLKEVNTVRAGMVLGFKSLVDQFNQANRQLGESLVGTIGTAQEELANGFADVATGARSANEAASDLAKSIVSDLLRALARWAAQQATMFALQAFGITTVSATAIAAAAGLTTAWTPAAVMASIATLGGAAGIGSAAVAAALAGSIAGGAAAGAASSSAGSAAFRGIAHGGMQIVPQEGTYLLDRGERVLSADQNRDLTRFLQNAQGSGGTVAGGDGGVVVINNGAPVEVSSTRIDPQGRREIVLEAVAAVRNDFAESTRNGYGPYDESIRQNYRTGRNV